MEWTHPETLARAKDHLDVADDSLVSERVSPRVHRHLHSGFVEQEDDDLVDEHEGEADH